jgi:hypothetical protein
MASHGYNKAKKNSPVPPSALPLSSKQRQSMPVTNEHQPKLKLRTGKPFPPRTHLKKFQCKSNGKINFQPPLSDGSSDSPAVNANPCPSVTGIASNRQNYIQIASLFPGPSENHSACQNYIQKHGKHGIFPPPLGHPSSDSPAVNANPCPSVTGIASNRQTDSEKFSLFIRGIGKSLRP